jgi:O-antigen/teichoic acid export membrane protein
MSTIRRQSIISSFVVYFGFALGFLNTYLFTREGGFTKEQYGLTGAFIALANIMFSIASLGMPAFINKFFPYYQARLKRTENDLLSWALLISCVGFLFVSVFGVAFKDVILERFKNSPGIGQYYYWIFPFGFGLTLFSVLEAFAWQHQKPVLTNFLKEVLFRVAITVLIVFTTMGLIQSFDLFIKSYSFLYLFVALILLGYLFFTHKAQFFFKVSKVTRRFFNKIIALCSFVWTGSLIFNVANVFDTIVLTAVLPNGLAVAGIFTLAQNISSLIQAPQRGIISAAIGPLSQAWKEKNFDKIHLIYQRSSINQLIFSCAMFSLIWLNFEDGVLTFGLQPDYIQAKYVFLFIGLTRIIDMGTGVNAQIIGTSTFWRFEFITGLILLALSLPLNYVLTRQMGIIGPAISNLVAFTIYNAIRYYFLLNRFNMQPFTLQSVYTILLGIACYFVAYWLFKNQVGFMWIVLRSAVFMALFGAGVIMLKLTPDLLPVLVTIKKKLGMGNQQ